MSRSALALVRLVLVRCWCWRRVGVGVGEDVVGVGEAVVGVGVGLGLVTPDADASFHDAVTLVAGEVPATQNPESAYVAPGSAAAQLGAVIVTCVPLRATVPFQLLEMVAVVGKSNSILVMETREVRPFVTATLLHQPEFQEESVTIRAVTPPGLWLQ